MCCVFVCVFVCVFSGLFMSVETCVPCVYIVVEVECYALLSSFSLFLGFLTLP